MITIIAGTNRIGSKTLQIATYYNNMLARMREKATLISLENKEFFSRNENLVSLEQELLIPCKQFIFVIPEYNGSFPGVLKLMIDNTDIRQAWWGKRALLVGVANGRGGNLRGLDHFASVLQYLKMDVFHQKLPLSKINEITDMHGNVIDEQTEATIKQQVNDFIFFCRKLDQAIDTNVLK